MSQSIHGAHTTYGERSSVRAGDRYRHVDSSLWVVAGRLDIKAFQGEPNSPLVWIQRYDYQHHSPTASDEPVKPPPIVSKPLYEALYRERVAEAQRLMSNGFDPRDVLRDFDSILDPTKLGECARQRRTEREAIETKQHLCGHGILLRKCIPCQVYAVELEKRSDSWTPK